MALSISAGYYDWKLGVGSRLLLAFRVSLPMWWIAIHRTRLTDCQAELQTPEVFVGEHERYT
jgi:hypothetical protein